MKFLLLDFDGTLIGDNGGGAYDPATVTLLPGVVESLQRLRDVGMYFFIVSNQSKIGRGICGEENVRACFDHVMHLLKEQGLTIEAAQWCPHRPEDGCDCRKPKIGMWEMFRARFPELRADETTLVGDADTDVLFGKAIGCQTARIFSSRHSYTIVPTFLIRSLPELVDLLLAPAERVLPLSEVALVSRRARAEGKVIVTTNGVFDFFHAGHQFFLEEARKQGDVLIVGVNSDASVRRLKGEGRPLQTAETRARNVTRFADAVFIFEDGDPRPWLPQIRPHVHVNAVTYGVQCVERPVLDAIGAELVLVPVKEELGSTTQFLSGYPLSSH